MLPATVVIPTEPETVGSDLLTSMYEQLHSEINQRLDLRQGILTFTLLVAASLFGLGLQSWVNAVTVLCYPIFALFLALVWEQHDNKIGQIAAFLRKLEDAHLSASDPGWERWRRERFKTRNHQIALPAKGVFLVSEMLAVLIGLARFEPQASLVMHVLFAVLLCADLAALVCTLLAIQHHRER